MDDILLYKEYSEKATGSTGILSQNYDDVIHGQIPIDPTYWEIIETPEFNRLKQIKQLGLNFLVFPRTTHNRYEHCIGTFHLANVLLDNLRQKHGAELNLEHGDATNIATAALCHDLGHGPFSHTFDNTFMQVRFPELDWTHERGSIELFEHMIDENNIDSFEKSDIKLITDLILGSIQLENSNSPSQLPFNSSEKGWMFEIVNNKRNCIDVDKFDYIQRDSYYVDPTKYGYDFSVLTNNARVLQNQICYPVEIQKDVYGLFASRYTLFEEVYLNKKTQAAEVQVCDVFFEANDFFKFDLQVQDMQKYKGFTDNILDEIRAVDHPSLKQAHKLIDRMANEDYYEHVCSKSFEPHLKKEYSSITPAVIAEFSDGHLVAEDIRVCTVKLNFGMGDHNPLDYVSFYERDSNDNISIVTDSSVLKTSSPPIKYALQVVATDKSKSDLIKKAFCRALKEKTGTTLD